MNLNISTVQAAMKRKGYKWLDDGEPMLLNLVGIRAASRVPNQFDDYLTVSYFNGGSWKFQYFKATTDPGSFWLLHPMRVTGTAILKPGQYLNCWQIGKHQGKYEALVQCAPLTVLRDNDLDNRLSFDTQKEEKGLFGINIHRANPARESIQVDKWSAGCQVLANPVSFNKLMELVREAHRLRKCQFSYTLLEEKDLG